MPSRERVLTAFSHKEPDRVPAWCGASPEFGGLPRRHLGLPDDESLFLHLGDDFRRVYARYSGPDRRAPAAGLTHPEAILRTPFGLERRGYGFGQPLDHPPGGGRTGAE